MLSEICCGPLLNWAVKVIVAGEAAVAAETAIVPGSAPLTASADGVPAGAVPAPSAPPNVTFAVPRSVVPLVLSGDTTCTDHCPGAVCVQFSVMACDVPCASYTCTCEVIGPAVAGVAGGLAASVTVPVACGGSLLSDTWIGAIVDWLTAPVAGLTAQPFR